MTRKSRKTVEIYARAYVAMLRNAKLVDRSDLAWRLYISSILWCRDEGNDGYVPESALIACVPGRTKSKLMAVAGELSDAGLWLQNGSGWQIHDYDKHQDTSSVIAANRERTSAAALIRWKGEPEP